MADDAQDRQLPASERKIRKARAEGQVARSRDLAHLAALGAGGALLFGLAPFGLGWMRELLAGGLRFDAALLAQPGSMLERLAELTFKLLVVVLPLGVAVAAVALAAGVLAGGWNFTTQPLQPKFEKLNPLAGLGRMFSKHQMVETLKACGLALVLGVIGALYLSAQVPGFTGLIAQPLPAALGSAGGLLVQGLALLLLALAAFAIVDVPLQRTLLLRRLRMTVEEAKKEHKETEGNPEIKARLRQKMREISGRKMLAAVPQADLVVMNPTHFAVALKYDDATMAAPRVVAKGQDLLAFKIRDLAKDSKVPVLQAPPLARALFHHAEVDQEIPAALFAAVAQVLAWVYQLRAAVAAGRPLDLAPPDVTVPPGLDPLSPRIEPEL
jgi:flagellar biosynthesis protein FlhB